MMQSVKSSSHTRSGLFASPQVLSPRVPDSRADGVCSELASGNPTLIHGLSMSFRDRKIKSDTESDYRPQHNGHSTLYRSDSIKQPKASNFCASAEDSLAYHDSTSEGNISETLDGMLSGRTNDIFSQYSSNDLADVPLCNSTVKSNEVDLMHQLTSLSPCSLKRPCDMQHQTEANDSNSTSRHYLAKNCNKVVDRLGECGVEHIDAQLSRLTVNLPSVEDGLSSGSELDVSDYLSQEVSTVKSPNTHSRLNAILHNSSSRSTTHSPSSSPIRPISIKGSLVNPPLVQDIFGIMRDIKLALSDDTDATARSAKPPSDVLGARIGDNTAEKNQSTVTPSYPEFCGNTNTIPPDASTKSITSIYGPDIPTTGNCSRITVQASIEQQCDNSIANDLAPQRTNTCFSTETTRCEGQTVASTSSPPGTGKYAHHWSFPQSSSVAYSSDEDIAPVRPATHRSSRPGQRARSSQTVPAARNKQLPSGALPSHESDAGDTEKLLPQGCKPDNPISLPEQKAAAAARQAKRLQTVREVSIRHPDLPDHLIHGFLFHARYLGSTQLVSNRPPTRSSRLYQAKEAFYRVKDPDGDHQPSVAIEFFVSVERIMIMDHTLKEILIDHSLRTVSYIADIGDVLVLMARAPSPPAPPPPPPPPPTAAAYSPSCAADQVGGGGGGEECDSSSVLASSGASTSPSSASGRRGADGQPACKLLCHVLESDEAQLVTQAVNHAFQLAYLDYLREHGIDDLSTVDNLRYDDGLHEQEIFCDELASFCNKEKQKQVTIPKQRGEPLGLVIVSSGWGSLVPTALLANMLPTGPAARCGQLNIGNRIIAVNGQSLVGLSLPESQALIKACRSQTSVRLTIVDCPPVTEVFIRRPSVEHQLGFSVQDGVICSLLRGGIAERGGIRVDHRIIEINDESVVAMPHEYIVQLLTVVTGEIHIRTMPTAVFRLLTGQETPNYI